MASASKIRVLHIGTNGERGGIEAFILNICSHLEKDAYSFSITADCESAVIEQEFRQLGGEVLYIPSASGHKIGYILALWKLIDAKRFDVVHIHKNSLANPAALYICKARHIRKVILHSHNTQPTRGRISAKLHAFFKKRIKDFHVVRLACSEKAGRWLFGENADFTVFCNAIDLQKYSYDALLRKHIRKSLHIEDKFVIGHIGRFCYQKNHDLLIDIFMDTLQVQPDAVLLLIGEGELEQSIREKVKANHIEDKVLFLGRRQDAYRYYNAMDCFVFPSRYEGLGIVTIEAQANGLPVVCSTEVPQEAGVTDLVSFIGLDASPRSWTNQILKIRNTPRKDELAALSMAGYDIIDTVRKMEHLYSQ